MKKVIVIVICLFSLSSFAQNFQRVKDAKEIVWFGLDYTKTKFRGLETDFKDLDKIRNNIFEEWNILMLQEKEKYNLEKVFRKEKFSYNVKQAIERNKEKDMSNMVSIDEYNISKEDIKGIVDAYNVEGGSDIGLVFIVESLDKIDEEITIWITFFDIKTKEVLFSKKVSGKAGGVGFKNYWAGGIYQIFKKCDDDFKAWLKGRD